MLLDIPHIQQAEGSSHCGAVCLQMIYEFCGDHHPVEDILRSVMRFDPSTGRTNCRSYAMALHAQSLGYKSNLISCMYPFDFIRVCLESGINVIPLYRNHPDSPIGHFSVITGLSKKGVYLNDPRFPALIGKNRFVPFREFEDLLAPVCGSDIQSPNTMLLVAPADTSMSILRLAHDDCRQDIEVFSAIVNQAIYVCCLEHDRWFARSF